MKKVMLLMVVLCLVLAACVVPHDQGLATRNPERANFETETERVTDGPWDCIIFPYYDIVKCAYNGTVME